MIESRGKVGLISMDRLKESMPRSGCVREGPCVLCFCGTVDTKVLAGPGVELSSAWDGCLAADCGRKISFREGPTVL